MFVENIPRHIAPKSGFESFPEYTQCVQGGSVCLASTREIQPGEEIYVRHAPGVIQWDCFHPNGCTSGMLVLSDRTLPITPNSFCGLLFFIVRVFFVWFYYRSSL